MQEMQRKAREISTILKVLANENRLLILCELVNGPLTVSELLEKLNTITQSGISQHLSILKANGILDYKKNAQHITYKIKDDKIYQMMTTLKELYCT